MRKLGLVGLALLSCLVGCANASEDAEDSAPMALRADPTTSVTTNDSSVRVLSGYNSFLDHAATAECITATDVQPPEVGGVDGSFYLRHVKTREELAKELNIDLSASVKAPQGSLDATVKFVNSFKQSSTTVTFIVRSVRSYTVSNRSPIQLSPLALDLLTRGQLPEFLQKCGGSYAKSVRYEAQVLAMLQFEAKTEESARTIETSFGGATPAATPGAAAPANAPAGTAAPISAAVDLKTRAEQTASSNGAALSMTITASGFVSNGRKVGDDIGEHTFEKIDQLHRDLAASFDQDLIGDRNNYFTNTSRNARAALVGQASYASVGNAPTVDYTKLSSTLSRAEQFVGGIAPVYVRMEHAYNDEVMRFLGDPANQYRYNLAVAPKTRTTDLVAVAQGWAEKFGPDGSRQNGSLVEPLRRAVERCTSDASNGRYDACANNPDTNAAKAAAEAALKSYAQSGRILSVNALMPTLGRTVSYWNAEGECNTVGMRLPKRDEMPAIAPAVTALAGPSGEVWFAGDSTCGTPFYSNADGIGAFKCEGNWLEAVPYIADRPVVCVARSGPIAISPAP